MGLFQPAVFLRYVLSADYALAALVTLWISLAALALGTCMGVLLAIGQEARAAVIRCIVAIYILFPVSTNGTDLRL
jgi:ABC-type amino acid transport system permease subunit